MASSDKTPQLRLPDWLGFDRVGRAWFVYFGSLSIGWECRVWRVTPLDAQAQVLRYQELLDAMLGCRDDSRRMG